MKAVLCKAFTGPSSLVFEAVARAALAPGEIRVQVKASGLNFADSIMIAGHYQVQPPLPFVPGLEAAGVVIEVGAAVAGFAVGDHVVGLTSSGGYAEELAAAADRFLKIPPAMDFTTAAAFSVTHGTAHIGLERRARLRPGEVLLVLGAAGGAGLAAVQIGKLMGAVVIAAAGGPEKLAVAAAHGADYLIDYSSEDIRARVLQITGGRGADVVYDPVGGAAFSAALRAIAFEGRIVVVGFASGEVPQIPANHLLVKNVDIIGLYWGGYKGRDMATLRRSAQTLIGWWEDGRLVPHIGATFPLAEAADALAFMLARKSTGKIVLIP